MERRFTMKTNKQLKTPLEKEPIGTLTPHQALAAEMGIPTNYLSALKRQKVVPQKIEDFTPADRDVIIKMRAVYCDSELLRLQLQEFTLSNRRRLAASADDFCYKKWERRTIKIYSASYAKLAGIKSDETMNGLWEKFRAPAYTTDNWDKAHAVRRLAADLAKETPEIRRKHRKGLEERHRSEDPEQLQRWELRVLHFYIQLYSVAPEIGSSSVMEYLFRRYNVQNTPDNSNRVQKLRRIAAGRVRLAAEKAKRTAGNSAPI